MKNEALIKRYAQGLLNSCRDDKEYVSLHAQLRAFAEFLDREKKLYGLFITPFLPISKKLKVAEEVLSRISPSEKISRFIRLFIENDRIEILPHVVAILPDLWNEEKGIITYEVSSVISLTDKQKDLLIKKLENIEKGPVALKYKQNPTLIGGISLRKGNVVYDASQQYFLFNKLLI